LTIPRHPGRLNRPVLAVAASTHVSTAVLADVAALSPGLRTSPTCPERSQRAASDARLGRIRLAEQPVVSLFQGTTATRAASCRTSELLGGSPTENPTSLRLDRLGRQLTTRALRTCLHRQATLVPHDLPATFHLRRAQPPQSPGPLARSLRCCPDTLRPSDRPPHPACLNPSTARLSLRPELWPRSSPKSAKPTRPWRRGAPAPNS
jgi:hypothetical protein